MSKGLEEMLGPAYADLAERVEADLADHVAELNERRRNLLTLRALGVTSVSALLTATVVTDEALLALFAGLVVCVVVYADLDANRRIEAIEKRLPFIETLVLNVRRCLARGDRDSRLVHSTKTDLHTYKRTPPGTDEVPWGRVWRSPVSGLKPRWPLTSTQGGLRVRHALGGFEGFYFLQAAGCVALGLSALLAPNKVAEVVSCHVPANAHLSTAADRGYCSPGAPSTRPVCRVPPVVRSRRLVVHCSDVRGAVAVNIASRHKVVLSRAVAVQPDGTLILRITCLRRGAAYRATITSQSNVLADKRPIRFY